MIINTEASRCDVMVDVYPSFRCNYSCAYCCSRHSKQRHNSELNLDDFKDVLNVIKSYDKSVCFAILGGEPTLYKGLMKLILMVSEVSQIEEIELYSNGTNDLSKYLLPKVIPIVSIHTKYFKKYEERILENIKPLRDIKHRIKIMVEGDKNLLEYIFDKLRGYNVYADYIEDIDTDTIEVKSIKVPELEERKVIDFNGKMMSMFQYLRFIKLLKNRTCYPREIEIFPDLSSRTCCDLARSSGSKEDFKRVYAEFIKSLRTIECDRRCCYIEYDKEIRKSQ